MTRSTSLLPAVALAVLLGAVPGLGVASTSCSSIKFPQPLPIRNTPVPPISTDLQGLAAAQQGRLFDNSPRESLAFATVMTRILSEGCVDDRFAGYQKRTEFDNEPWRFRMHQDGRAMTPADFAKWMESRGMRIAKGRPGTAQPAAAPTEALESEAPTEVVPTTPPAAKP